ncbi:MULTISPECIES: universal stress protein [Halomicrobium]|uniref:UpsA domain-containing protein n=2 Tax=Halomicrobium mukohataei TaxID=57705 RepID=C7P271_HALMD|nr:MULTISPECIES: universal stress protein [Halomicrobium]ACV47300.1 UpsA domain-containing protein [Halomicrobium mukohataei DSM 12286]QCD65770.1 universal stress protein [Halomicrobium mukohataei]QFR20575.1 universal stress protein [Halomicrobium sp. ZPS1]
MDDALVVLDTDERGRELLTEAAQLAGGADARLHVLSLLTHEAFEEKRESLDAVAAEEHTSYDDGVIMDDVHQDAEAAVEEVVGDYDVEWDVVAGRVGQAENEADRILEAAADNDIDHVFLTGDQRSPTGKAVFGDRAQAVIINFDGPVTSLLG